MEYLGRVVRTLRRLDCTQSAVPIQWPRARVCKHELSAPRQNVARQFVARSRHDPLIHGLRGTTRMARSCVTLSPCHLRAIASYSRGPVSLPRISRIETNSHECGSFVPIRYNSWNSWQNARSFTLDALALGNRVATRSVARLSRIARMTPGAMKGNSFASATASGEVR